MRTSPRNVVGGAHQLLTWRAVCVVLSQASLAGARYKFRAGRQLSPSDAAASRGACLLGERSRTSSCVSSRGDSLPCVRCGGGDYSQSSCFPGCGRTRKEKEERLRYRAGESGHHVPTNKGAGVVGDGGDVRCERAARPRTAVGRPGVRAGAVARIASRPAISTVKARRRKARGRDFPLP